MKYLLEKMQTIKNEFTITTTQGPGSQKLLPNFAEKSCFRIHANDDSKLAITFQDADIPQKV